MAFLYSTSSHEGFPGEQGDLNTCMLHVRPSRTTFCTVTCYLETLSRRRTSCLFLLDHLKVVLFLYIGRNVNSDLKPRRDDEHAAVACADLRSLGARSACSFCLQLHTHTHTHCNGEERAAAVRPPPSQHHHQTLMLQYTHDVCEY